jgi:hypothetical protein
MADSDYAVMLKEFTEAGATGPSFCSDPEKQHYLRVGKLCFWFDDAQNLLRIERLLDPLKGISRVLVCKPIKGQW